MDFKSIKGQAEKYESSMTKFLRDLIAIPGESCGEKDVINRIAQEMEMLGFDKVEIDGMGNILGYMGNGETLIGYDAHIDTVGLGELSNWNIDPYKGYENDEEIGGRGASDQLGGIVSATYGAKIMKDLGLLSDKYTVLVTGTVQEEDCDGLCWQYIYNEDKVKPEFVVITEPTNGNIYRGQRGRMEIRVEVKGVSCHGSAPERGDNAIYKMADILQEVRVLNDNLHYDEFLGKGTITVSEIFFNSPSRCAVADMCAISLDRRLTDGETYESALEEVRNLPFVKKYNAEVSMYKYERPSYTDLVYPTDCYFPTWVIPEDAPATKAMVEAYKGMYGEPKVDKWTFSTNGVSIMGRFGIPCIGFGPGKEEEAHAPNEKTWKADLVRCAAVYAAMPTIYCKNK
ncbi:YgeY family selenium metabolism-linked hydrolase [uncultured Clostridium sp.]|uniref:YgeY family selenium metabolism-linked hydrolase n=1 Tax=uncultured Clostridium sp. TaxID=59620 RepID=UPI0025E50385|nr:YgeY family selenium metabolism-linked hydrolase [uncultured Clostridium sp.]MDU4884270.1 YgeY family selenium metabolism-linked hydrolase [Clostridium celatum]MDU7077443.1 YgeY family selenium metabolism-linked hydrolase [Clostridium celatum]